MDLDCVAGSVEGFEGLLFFGVKNETNDEVALDFALAFGVDGSDGVEVVIETGVIDLGGMVESSSNARVSASVKFSLKSNP